MHNTPHPNQVRSACERCRRQKLRCTRPTPSDPSEAVCCARCLRLGLSCQPGTQRKVGRPARKELVKTAVAPPPVPIVIDDIPADVFEQDVSGSGGGGFTNDVLLTGMLDDGSAGGIDWNLANDLSFNFGGLNHFFGGPSEMPLSYETHRPDVEQPAMLVLGPNDKLFASLSRVNLKLHDSWDPMGNRVTSFGDELAFCQRGSSFINLDALRMIISSTQEYLATIKALHRRIGVKTGTRPPSVTSTPEDGALTLLDRSANSDGQNVFNPETTATTQNMIPDSHTAFLLISCYSQIVKHIEAITTIVITHFRDKSTPLMSPASEMTLMDVDILEFSTQVGLFSELVRHLITQTTLVLGIPVHPWTDRTIWTGLLKADRYREMLNEELGGPTDGMWTTRPAKLLDMVEETRQLVLDAAMMGDG